MNILLIAGHGAGDPGAVSRFGGVSYQEASLARSLVSMMKTRLSGYAHVDIYPTERCAYDDVCAGTASRYGDFSKYGYVLEIHFNAFRSDTGDGKRKGSEAYVTASEAGISVEEAILTELQTLGFPNRGVKRKNFTVIAAAKARGVSSCLLEVCFVDDWDDLSLYQKSPEAVAGAIARGIIQGFGLSAETPTTYLAAIETLSSAGIIQSPEYWQSAAPTLPHLDELLIKMANYISRI